MRAVVLLLVWMTAIPAPAAAQDSDAQESLRELQESIEALQQSLEEHDVREAQDTRIDILSDRFFDQAQAEDYASARATLEEWESLDPEDPRLPQMGDLLGQLEAEPDAEQKQAILAGFTAGALEVLVDDLGELDRRIDALNEGLDRLEETLEAGEE